MQDGFSGRSAFEKGLAERPEGVLTFAGHRVVGEGDDLLLAPLVAHLWAAEDDDNLRLGLTQKPNDLQSADRVPDIDPEPYDSRLSSQDGRDDGLSGLLDLRLNQGGLLGQVTEVRQEIPKSK